MRQLIAQAVSSPAAGADWSFVPAGGDKTKLLAITAKLVTSGTASNRQPSLQITDETGNLLVSDVSTAAQPASVTGIWSWRSGASQYGGNITGTAFSASAPDFWLPAGAKVGLSTAGIEAADQWSTIVASYLACSEWEWLQLQEAWLQSVALS